MIIFGLVFVAIFLVLLVVSEVNRYIRYVRGKKC